MSEADAQNLLQLNRFAVTMWGTLSYLVLPDGRTFATLEPPPKNNEPGRSCIPCGRYGMEYRQSSVMQSIMGEKVKGAWFLVAVPHRASILIHPGNTLRDTHGCILLGRQHSLIKGAPAVVYSRAACADFDQRMRLMEKPTLQVTWPATMPARL